MKRETLKNLFDSLRSKCGINSKITEEELDEMFKEANYGEINDQMTFESFLKFVNK